jgi:hypothetical protein
MAMKALRSLTVLAALVAVLGLAGTSEAQERMKHSGSVVSIDEAKGMLVLAEIGPWMVREGKTVITYRTITLTPDTAFAIASRDYATLEAWPGQFVENALPAGSIYANDYVTIDCLHKGTQQIALKITVSEVGEP